MIKAAEPAKLSHNEVLKQASPTLAGTLAATLADPDADRFSSDDTQFLKFHGIYQQDDRDKRKTGKQFMFMVRTRLPGGVMPAKQYAIMDDLASRHANNTLRITSRQGFQLHGVVKGGLGKAMRELNEALITTLAACGDVNRNVMAPSTPATSPLVERVLEDARLLSQALLPITKAYHQIWVEGQPLKLADKGASTDGSGAGSATSGAADGEFEDPLYGKTYLPRKFKTAFAIPPLNDIDVFTNCLGFVAIADGDKLAGYNLLAGGGLGRSHNNQETFPRMADVVGFFTPEHIENVAKAVLTIHRDFGDRGDRKHARLKYVLEDRGVDWFREEMERRTGIQFKPARPAEFTRQGDLFGWHEQLDGRYFCGLYVETGRIQDTGDYRLKSALRAIADRFDVEIRLTPSQNLLLAHVAASDRDEVTRILSSHGVPVDAQGSALRRASMACPALPTCGLALAESERMMPAFLDQVEDLLKELGLGGEEIVIRMTGCPNGCARPYMAEIGFVGKAPNKYQLYLGGNESSTRLNRLYREVVKTDEIIGELRPLLTRYVAERTSGERFGDFCERVILKEESTPAAN